VKQLPTHPVKKKLIEEFKPYKTDIVFQGLSAIAGRNPVMISLIYFLLSYVFLQLIGLSTGQFYGKNGAPPMYTVFVDNLNLAFLAPLGAGLLCYLYKMICQCFKYITDERLIEKSEEINYQSFINKLDKLYNSRIAITISASLSIIINSYNYLFKPTTATWLGLHSGISGAYGRFFVTINYFMILLIIYKCIVTVWGLYKLLSKYTLRVQPMHPDSCGGLRPIGSLAIAVNYFIGVVLIFISLLFFFDEYARNQAIYPILFILFYALAPFLLFFTLSKANRRMREMKAVSLKRLANTFDHYYRKLDSSGDSNLYDTSTADEITKIYDLYNIVEKMPVWPFDIRSLVRFFTTITLPAFIFLIQQLLDSGSLIHIWFRKILGL